MKLDKNLLNFLYRHPVVRYIVVGGSTFVIDFSLLFFLHGKLNVHLAIAASISYWVSITYNFSLNRSWTFSARDKTNLHKHLMAYLILLTFNYLFTIIFISLASHFMNYLVAKTVSVIIQTAWTYFIYKNYVFTDKAKEEL